MERLPSLEQVPVSIDAALERAKSHAIPYQEATALIKEAEQLESIPNTDIERLAFLKEILDQSTVTVQTLEEFEQLLEKTESNPALLEKIIGKGTEHAKGVEHMHIGHEGYSVLVMKDGDQYRYKSWASYSYPAKEEIAVAQAAQLQIETRAAQDMEDMNKIRREIYAQEYANHPEMRARKMAYELGFEETSFMETTRKEMLFAKERPREYFIQWSDAAEANVEAIPNDQREKYAKASIGRLVAQAAIYIDLEMPDDYNSELESAQEYAERMGYTDIAKWIEDLKA